METFVALLRGINVGGHHKVPMAELRELASGLGWIGVETYIASGNVVFDSDADDPAALAAELGAAVEDQFGFVVPVVVAPADVVTDAVTDPPWPDDDPSTTGVAFLSAPSPPRTREGLDPSRWAPDEMVVRGALAHLRLPNGFGRANLTLDRIERELGVTATTRNRRTVAILAEMCAART